MKIAVCNFKGGVGKTSIALNMALTLGCSIVTNDTFSPLKKVLPEKQFIKLKSSDKLPRFDDDFRVVFDLNGKLDVLSKDSLMEAKWILIPVTADFIDIQVSINCINMVQQFNPNIIVLANKTERQEFKGIAAAIHRFFNYPVFNIKKSKALPSIFKQKVSVANMCARSNFPYKKQFGIVAEQFGKLILFMEKMPVRQKIIRRTY